jgi:hypothetical protein
MPKADVPSRSEQEADECLHCAIIDMVDERIAEGANAADLITLIAESLVDIILRVPEEEQAQLMAHTMDENADMAEKINELLGAVAALKAYVAHLPGAADVDLEAVRRAGRDTGAGLIGGVHPSTHVNDAVDDIQRMASALKPWTD